MRVTLPEGNTQNLRLTDTLPPGLGYVSHSVITTAAASGGLLAVDYNGVLTTRQRAPAAPQEQAAS